MAARVIRAGHVSLQLASRHFLVANITCIHDTFLDNTIMLSALRQGISRKISALSKSPQTAATAARYSPTLEYENTTSIQHNTDDSPKSVQEPQPGRPKNELTSNAQPKRKTMAELDEELRQKMSGLSGDGGDAGIEYEDGQPVSMKRSVKNNMFRYI